MWLELAMGVCGGLFLGGGAFVAVEMHRPILLSEDLVDRIKKIARPEVGWRFKRKPRHLSIEMAMHLDADVDMKWWQDEFDKLQRTITTNVWTKFDDARVSDPLPPTSSEWGGWLNGQEMVYSFAVMRDTIQKTQAELEGRIAEVEEAKAKIEAHGLYRPKSTDDYDLAVDLSHHAEKQAADAVDRDREEALDAIYASDDMFRIVPVPESNALIGAIYEAKNQAELKRACDEAKSAVRHYRSRVNSCPDCDYDEQQTYASKYAYLHRTKMCERCLAEDVAHRIKEISGYWG